MALHKTFKVNCPDCRCRYEVIRRHLITKEILCEDCAYKRVMKSRNKSYKRKKSNS